MRKRNSYTVLEQAVDAALEFETMLKKLSGQVTLRRHSIIAAPIAIGVRTAHTPIYCG